MPSIVKRAHGQSDLRAGPSRPSAGRAVFSRACPVRLAAVECTLAHKQGIYSTTKEGATFVRFVRECQVGVSCERKLDVTVRLVHFERELGA